MVGSAVIDVWLYVGTDYAVARESQDNVIAEITDLERASLRQAIIGAAIRGSRATEFPRDEHPLALLFLGSCQSPTLLPA